MLTLRTRKAGIPAHKIGDKNPKGRKYKRLDVSRVIELFSLVGQGSKG